jgi:hypothetical protein
LAAPTFEMAVRLGGNGPERPGRTMANNGCPLSIVCGFRSARAEPLGPVLYYMVISEANPGIVTKKTGFKPWLWSVSRPAAAMGFVQVPEGPEAALTNRAHGFFLLGSGVGFTEAWISMGWPCGGRGARMIEEGPGLQGPKPRSKPPCRGLAKKAEPPNTHFTHRFGPPHTIAVMGECGHHSP